MNVQYAESPGSIVSMRTWDEEEFARSSREWEQLLACSAASPLFMSWAWQHAWWQECAASLGSELQIHAAYSPSGELVGLAPLHLRRVTHRVPIRTARLESLGSTWREKSGIFSEYLDFIVRPDYAQAFLQALAARLQQDDRWHEFIVANSPANGSAARFAQEFLADACYLRKVDLLTAHRTDLPAQFDDYVAKLHAGTRRKLWNHRRRLQDPQFALCAEGEIDAFLDELDSFHERRWGKRHFLGSRRAFHRTYARAMARSGTLRMSRLAGGRETISLMYNVRLQGTEYNLQSGFNMHHGALSPGYLHFGFCMERASREGVRHFDFLVGSGRNRDYKHDFNTRQTELATYHSIRMRPLAWLYRQYDRTTAGSRKPAPILSSPAEADCGT